MSEKKTKRLTVIIPGYNNPEAWWRRALESAIANVGDEDEILCIDDGSSTRPLFLEGYSKKDSRVKVIYSETNGGLSRARNIGIQLALGRYVTFLDSDDELLPDTYDKVLETIKRTNADVCVFGVRTIWVDERLYKEDSHQDGFLGSLDGRTLKELFDGRLFNYAWNKIYKLSLLQQYSILFDPNGMPCEDTIFNLACVSARASWACVNHIGICYYQTHKGSLLSRYKKSYVSGMSAAANAWQKCKMHESLRMDALGELGEITQQDIELGEWDNIWRENSPYDMIGRWVWLKSHRAIARHGILWFYIRKLAFSFFRKYAYISPLRRWHIKRIYSGVKQI